MEQKNIQMIKREFRFGEQGYTLVKTLVFVYALRKSDIDFTLEIMPGVKYPLNNLCKLANSNLCLIDEMCGRELGEIVRDCIVSFGNAYLSTHELNVVLRYIEDMTNEEIADFIINYANTSGERNDFSSPKGLIELVIGILEKSNPNSWFDVGCGNGDFLVEVSKTHNKDLLVGQDIHYNSQLLTKIRLYFANVKSFISENNILESKYDSNCDVAYANTPLVMRVNKDIDYYNNLNRYVGRLRPSQNADWIFADRLLQIIKHKGVIVMTEASLMNIIDADQRKCLVEQNLIEGIIRLPNNIFSYTGIPVSLVIFNKNKTDKFIRFLDASGMCTQGRRYQELNVEEILNAYHSNDKVTEVSNEEIAKENYSLHVKKYLDVNDIVLEDETILEEVVEDVFRGVQIPANKIDEYSKVQDGEETYKLISVGDIQNGSFEINELQKIKKDTKFDRYLIKNGDVLISSKSTKIKTAIVEISEEERIVATGSILVIRCKKEKINPVYLKVFFDSINGKKLLESIQTGTVIISINVSALLKMRISCIDIERQEMIAERYLMKLDQFKIAKAKLAKLEREISSIFEDSIGG